MPNWCSNDMEILFTNKLNEKELEKIKEIFPEDKISFKVIIPEPEIMIKCNLNDEIKIKKTKWYHKYKDICSKEQINEVLSNGHYLVKEGGEWIKVKDFEEDVEDYKTIPNWYDWNYENWGTKWDATTYYFEATESHITISFGTAWGINAEAISTAMFRKFLELNIELESITLSAEEPGADFSIVGTTIQCDNGELYYSEVDGETTTLVCDSCGKEEVTYFYDEEEDYRPCPFCENGNMNLLDEKGE